MPVCKNDSTKKYSGTEPSPKGLGFCAHAQDLGSKKTGLDKKQYIVDHDKNGRKYWKILSSEKKVAKKAIDKVKPALEKVVQAQEKAEKKITDAVMGAVAVGGPDAGAVVLSKIAEIQARLQTAKRSQIDEYLKAKKKQGLFKKPLKAKGYNIQNARADAISIRGSKSKVTQQQKNQVIDYFKLTGYHVDPESKYKDVEIVINYPKEVMDVVDYFADWKRPPPTTQQQQQEQHKKFQQGIKDKERALWKLVKPVLIKMGIKDFSYNEVSYASELTFDRIWIRPKDFTTDFVKNLKKVLPPGYSLSLQVEPARYDNDGGILMDL
jgi:hypothetical protein